MKERPIIFNAEMVKAILDGRKTQTRRALASKQLHLFDIASQAGECYQLEDNHEGSQSYYRQFCPFGAIGDRLWVRETFAQGLCTESTLAYKATHKPEDLEEGWFEKIKWTPSIHMPRWASRINLEVTNVRVERLKDISEEDAIAEGCDYPEVGGMGWKFKAAFNFKFLWKKIYGKESLNANPWVWVIEFKPVEGGAA